MKIYLSARDDDLFNAWKLKCEHLNDVIVTKQPIIYINAEAIVGPANSFCFMSGGIDLHYLNYFGRSVEKDLQDKIKKEFDGELLIGQATCVSVHHPSFPDTRCLVMAPTMRVPENISHTYNVYLATRAALRLARKISPEIKSIAFPGMGTGTGGLDVYDCAKHMAAAIYEVMVEPRGFPDDVYTEQYFVRNHLATSKWFQVQIME